MKRNLSIKDMQKLLPYDDVTFRRHARDWGAHKLQGSAKWLWTQAAAERLVEASESQAST